MTDKSGLVSLGGTGRDDISMQFASRGFSAMLDLSMGGCLKSSRNLSCPPVNVYTSPF